MPRGPKGEKRPADVIGAAVKVMQIATGERDEENQADASPKKRAGRLGGKARLAKLSPPERDGPNATAGLKVGRRMFM